MADEFVTPLLSALKDLSSWLKSSRVPGIVVGGVAASLLGRPRATRDIDVVVWVDFDNWKDFLEAGRKHGFCPRIKDVLGFAKENRAFLLRHGPSGIDVDVSLGSLSFEEESIRRAVKKRIRGVRISLPTPEDLIVMKAIAYRPRDLADIESILEAHPKVNLRRIRRLVREFSRALEMPEIFDDLDKVIRHFKKKL